VKYTFSSLAQNDVKDLIKNSYLSFGFDVTEQYQQGLNRCFNLLASTPLIGISADGLRTGYLKFPYKSHIVYYKVRKKDIFIVRLLHQRMNETKYL